MEPWLQANNRPTFQWPAVIIIIIIIIIISKMY